MQHLATSLLRDNVRSAYDDLRNTFDLKFIDSKRMDHIANSLEPWVNKLALEFIDTGVSPDTAYKNAVTHLIKFLSTLARTYQSHVEDSTDPIDPISYFFYMLNGLYGYPSLSMMSLLLRSNLTPLITLYNEMMTEILVGSRRPAFHQNVSRIINISKAFIPYDDMPPLEPGSNNDMPSLEPDPFPSSSQQAQGPSRKSKRKREMIDLV